MLRGRFNQPNLEDLDSPLGSPAPFSALSGVPGSALADMIFNDPDSWEDTDGDDGEFPEDVENDTLAWLTEEIEKFRRHSAGIDTNGSFDPASLDAKSSSLTSPPPPALPKDKHDSLAPGEWKGIGRRSSVRPISLLFEQPNEDFSSEIQLHLSKILESGGIPHHIRPRPLSSSSSSALSPPSTSGSLVSASTSSSIDSPLQIQTAVTSDGSMSPSPVAVYSASATLSFLEWYGIYPDSPLLDANNRKSIMQRKKSMKQRTPGLQVPSHSRPSSQLSVSTAGTATTFKQPLPKRNSSVPPPGLDAPAEKPEAQEPRPKSPPGLSRSSSPLRQNAPSTPPRNNSPHRRSPSSEEATPVQVASPTRSNSDSPSLRGRPLPTAAPPPYSSTPSPARPSLVGRSISGPAGPRRLPSIPPETTVPTPPQSQAPSRQTTPSPPPPSTRTSSRSRRGSPAPPAAPLPASAAVHSAALTSGAPLSFASFSFASASASTALATSTFSPSPLSAAMSPGYMPASATTGRPPSSIRSPLGGPAGPRIRSRVSQDAGARAKALPIGHRPPVLRL